MNELPHDGPQWVSIKTLLVSQHMDTGHHRLKSVYIYLASLTQGGPLPILLGDIKAEALLLYVHSSLYPNIFLALNPFLDRHYNVEYY